MAHAHPDDRPEGRQAGHFLGVLAGLDGVVQVFQDEDDAEGEEQADDRGEDRIEQDAWRGGGGRGRGRVDDREQVRAAVAGEAQHRGVRLAERDDPALERLQPQFVARIAGSGGWPAARSPPGSPRSGSASRPGRNR